MNLPNETSLFLNLFQLTEQDQEKFNSANYPGLRLTKSGHRNNIFRTKHALPEIFPERVRLRVVVGLRRSQAGPLRIPDLSLLGRLLYRILSEWVRLKSVSAQALFNPNIKPHPFKDLALSIKLPFWLHGKLRVHTKFKSTCLSKLNLNVTSYAKVLEARWYVLDELELTHCTSTRA